MWNHWNSWLFKKNYLKLKNVKMFLHNTNVDNKEKPIR